MSTPPPASLPVVSTPAPIKPLGVQAPDADWQTVRDRAVGGLHDGSWTDHNISDPGITMLEAGTLAVADAHYRTANRTFEDAPFASGMWRDSVHWSGVDLASSTEDLHSVATAVARHRTRIEEHLATASDRAEAVALIATDPTLTLSDMAPAPTVDYPTAQMVVRLLRGSVVRKASMDFSTAIDAAVETEKTEAKSAALLRYDPAFDGLWDAELIDLLEQRRRRRLADRMAQLRLAVARATDVAEAAAFLAPEDLTPAETTAVLASMPRPDVLPEFFEDDDGSTLVWPPTAIQTRSIEPTVADDYVRLALGVPGVRRAWLRSGRIEGIGWNGEPVAASDRPGTSTILIEAADDAGSDLPLAVLRSLALPGEVAEVDDPYQLYRTNLDLACPRRLICDEIGVATLSTCLIEIRAVLHVAVGTIDDRASVIATARDRLEAFFVDGRPESQPVDHHLLAGVDNEIDGPWPVPPPAPTGWIPGETIRFNEVVQILTDDPAVLGVSAVGLRTDGADWYMPTTDDVAELAISPDCVPRLAPDDCLTVSFELGGRP